MNIKKVELDLANEIRKDYAKYEPLQTSALSKSVTITQASGKTQIIYNAPYAHYVWAGKLYVDPITGKGAFYNPTHGFWSRPGVKKIETNKPLKYGNGRMARWTEHAKKVHIKKWTKHVEDAIKRG